MVRLAASPAALWTGIALDNADELDAALAGLGSTLDTLRAALVHGDADAVRAFFRTASGWTE
jgi:prephenate dehydrogenase